MGLPQGKLKGIFGRALTVLGKKEDSEIDHELPFAVMVFTLLTASGVALYESWKRMRNMSLLPNFQKEANEIVRQVEVLGRDPLSVMYDRAEKTRSKLYRDFLAGYVSSVKSGGSLLNFLKSKLRSIFEMRSNAITRSVERLGTLVEAYAVMLIITLCVYILYVVFASSFIVETVTKTSLPYSSYASYLVAFLFMPLLSAFFMFAAHKIQRSSLITLRDVYKKALLPAAAFLGLIGAVAFLPSLNFLTELAGWPLLITVGLVVISLPPAISYHRIAKVNFSAEEVLPSFLRDVTESRKIGLSPEKSIIHATKRKGYGRFSEFLHMIRSQIEWGVPMRRIFENLKEKIRSWAVLINFMIMIETVEIGGGSASALEILSEYSEKNRDVEANKRAMLKPYIILAFVWSILIAMTTTIVAITVYMLTQLAAPNLSPTMFSLLQEQIEIFSTGIIFQCWLSGFFVGKISEGAFAAGFKYSALLAITAYVSLFLSRNFLAGAFGIVPISS